MDSSLIEKENDLLNDPTRFYSHPRWDAIWSKGLEPGQGWDYSSPSPCLVEYVKDNKIPIGRALVPGCGRGYDVGLLAAPNRFCIGLEISETAIQAARDYINNSDQIEYKEYLRFDCISFFDLHPENDSDRFDFIYDYTFLCALHPSLRNDWANQMANLIKSGGLLMTLIFPIWNTPDEDESFISNLDNFNMTPSTGHTPNHGPPFRVTLQLMKDLLEPAGFICEELRMLPRELSHKGRDGGDDGSKPFSGVGMWRKK